MATLSKNSIIVDFVLDPSSLERAKKSFADLTEAEAKAVAATKEVNKAIIETAKETAKIGQEAQKTGKVTEESAKKTEEAFRKIVSPLKITQSELSSFRDKLRQAGSDAVIAGNKAAAGFAGIAAEERKAATAAATFRQSITLVNKELAVTQSQGVPAVKQVSQELSSVTSIVKSAGPALAAFFAVSTIKSALTEITQVNIQYQQYQKAIDFATGSSQNGAKAFQFLTETAQKYGLDLRALTEGYKGFAASSSLAGTTLEETNRQFLSVAKAAATLGLDSSRTSLVLNGLAQIASKGVVSMEELRQQIGDSLPGALGIAARAMNMTTAAFIKFTSDGKLASDVFLPKFATELEKTFGPTADKNLKSLTASQNRFNTSIDQLILSVGSKLEPLLKGAYDLAAGIATQLSGLGAKSKQQTAENVAQRRAEAEIAQKILDISIKEGVFVSRRVAAGQLLLDIDKKIDKQLNDNANNRIAKDNVRLKQGERNLEILQEEEKILTRIAGVEITAPKEKQVVLTKEQYELDLKRLQTLTAIRKLEQPDKAGQLGADAAFFEARLELEKKYFGTVETIRKEDIALTQAAAKKANEDLLQEQLKTQMTGIDQLDQYRKKRAEEEAKIAKDGVELRKLEKVKMEDIDKEFNQRELDRIKQQEEIKAQLLENGFNQAQTLANGLMAINLANIENERAANQRKYDEEVRLADGNAQLIAQINEKRANEERELRKKQFRAQQLQAVANVAFEAAPFIVKYIAGLPITSALLAQTLAGVALQTALIYAQPVPEFREGTKGKKFKGGRAVVGEAGVEKVITESGREYFTPGVASLVELPKNSQVIPHHQLTREDLYLGSMYANSTRSTKGDGKIVEAIQALDTSLKKIPIHQVMMDKDGFTTYLRTPQRTTRILNNRTGRK